MSSQASQAPVPYERDAHEENVLCALWQHYHEAIRYREISGCLLFGKKAFTHPARALIAKALLLCDGDQALAKTYLFNSAWSDLGTGKHVLALIEHFPMSPKGALRSAGILVDRCKGVRP